MESMKETLGKINLQSKEPKLYRFKLMVGELKENGKLENTKTVGMAYLREGQHNYTLRLWTFLSERFQMNQNKRDAEKYFVSTKEKNKNEQSKVKTFSNIIGSGKYLSSGGLIKIELDLFDKPIFMNTFPEPSAFGVSLPEPEVMNDAA